VAIPIVIAVAVGCSSADDDGEAVSATTDTTAVEDIVVDAGDFKPLADMTRVRRAPLTGTDGPRSPATPVQRSASTSAA
jgi:hypothetical protein